MEYEVEQIYPKVHISRAAFMLFQVFRQRFAYSFGK